MSTSELAFQREGPSPRPSFASTPWSANLPLGADAEAMAAGQSLPHGPQTTWDLIWLLQQVLIQQQSVQTALGQQQSVLSNLQQQIIQQASQRNGSKSRKSDRPRTPKPEREKQKAERQAAAASKEDGIEPEALHGTEGNDAQACSSGKQVHRGCKNIHCNDDGVEPWTMVGVDIEHISEAVRPLLNAKADRDAVDVLVEDLCSNLKSMNEEVGKLKRKIVEPQVAKDSIVEEVIQTCKKSTDAVMEKVDMLNEQIAALTLEKDALAYELASLKSTLGVTICDPADSAIHTRVANELHVAQAPPKAVNEEARAADPQDSQMASTHDVSKQYRKLQCARAHAEGSPQMQVSDVAAKSNLVQEALQSDRTDAVVQRRTVEKEDVLAPKLAASSASEQVVMLSLPEKQDRSERQSRTAAPAGQVVDFDVFVYLSLRCGGSIRLVSVDGSAASDWASHKFEATWCKGYWTISYVQQLERYVTELLSQSGFGAEANWTCVSHLDFVNVNHVKLRALELRRPLKDLVTPQPTKPFESFQAWLKESGLPVTEQDVWHFERCLPVASES
mmetsp:Transcript_26645/g.48838  ORF Transcript_26645/g.48838 Transcript_26645/m.48838 type:complete len:561 (-) Transcript_26645:69-1751(-)